MGRARAHAGLWRRLGWSGHCLETGTPLPAHKSVNSHLSFHKSKKVRAASYQTCTGDTKSQHTRRERRNKEHQAGRLSTLQVEMKDPSKMGKKPYSSAVRTPNVGSLEPHGGLLQPIVTTCSRFAVLTDVEVSRLPNPLLRCAILPSTVIFIHSNRPFVSDD